MFVNVCTPLKPVQGQINPSRQYFLEIYFNITVLYNSLQVFRHCTKFTSPSRMPHLLFISLYLYLVT